MPHSALPDTALPDTDRDPHLTATLSEARRVLDIEAQALATLRDNLPTGFGPAVAAMQQTRGRIIVCGLGKSGHIGRKIAATLASTGTPASFVQAAEASHGDMGMITADDLCLMISNSGETAELTPILAYAQRFAIPVIAISSRGDSTLIRAATHPLVLPRAPEACAMGLAPTTSTTLTLALGDALAMCLMARRGFAAEDFNIFHPGGRLGAQLMRVGALMHDGAAIPLVPDTAPMPEVLLCMTSKGFGLAGVTRAGRLVGVISDGDLRRNMEGLMTQTAGTIANTAPATITADALAAQALAEMNTRKITALFVTDADQRPTGVLHLHDCLRAGVA
ncbi:MAG: KpsF/GutQ family sugar-phosphate isomerase [Paracoccaceae bacterium]